MEVAISICDGCCDANIGISSFIGVSVVCRRFFCGSARMEIRNFIVVLTEATHGNDENVRKIAENMKNVKSSGAVVAPGNKNKVRKTMESKDKQRKGTMDKKEHLKNTKVEINTSKENNIIKRNTNPQTA